MIDKLETIGFFALMATAGILAVYSQVVAAAGVFLIAIWIEYTARKKAREVQAA